MRSLESDFASLDEKLQRAVEQRLKLQTKIQRRRTAITGAEQLHQEQAEDEVCNAEMRCHAESLTALLQCLYRAMG